MADVVFKLDAESAKAVRGFLQLDEAQRKVELSSKRATNQTKQHGKAMTQAARSAAGELKGLVTQYIGISAAMGAIGAAWRHTQKNIADSIRSMKEFQAEYVNLQFLGEHYKDPKLRGQVLELAAKYGTSPAEVARSQYALESTASWATDRQRNELLNRVLAMGQTTSARPSELAPSFGKTGGMYPGLTGLNISNLTQLILEQAAIKDPTELAANLPTMFAAGRTGRMSAAEAAALAAVMTGATGTTGQAAGGMDIVVRSVMGQVGGKPGAGWGRAGTGAGRAAILAKAGITEADTAAQRFLKLGHAYQSGQLDRAGVETIFGAEGLKYGIPLMEQPGRLQSMMDRMRGGMAPGVDIVGQKLETALAVDPTFKMHRAGARGAAGIAAAEQVPEYLMWGNLEQGLEEIRKRKLLGPQWNVKHWVDQQIMLMTPKAIARPLEEQAVEYLGGQLRGHGLAPPGQEEAMARQWLGLTAKELHEAAQNMNKASAKLDSTADRQKRFNAHVEPETAGAGGGGGY